MICSPTTRVLHWSSMEGPPIVIITPGNRIIKFLVPVLYCTGMLAPTPPVEYRPRPPQRLFDGKDTAQRCSGELVVLVNNVTNSRPVRRGLYSPGRPPGPSSSGAVHSTVGEGQGQQKVTLRPPSSDRGHEASASASCRDRRPSPFVALRSAPYRNCNETLPHSRISKTSSQTVDLK